MTDQEKLERGMARFDALSADDRIVMWNGLADGISRMGKEPHPRTVCHVAGNVSDEEWDAAVKRCQEREK